MSEDEPAIGDNAVERGREDLLRLADTVELEDPQLARRFREKIAGMTEVELAVWSQYATMITERGVNGEWRFSTQAANGDPLIQITLNP